MNPTSAVSVAFDPLLTLGDPGRPRRGRLVLVVLSLARPRARHLSGGWARSPWCCWRSPTPR